MSSQSSSFVNKTINYFRYLRDRRLIEKSDLYAELWYLNTYPDVAQAGKNPAGHYLRNGGFQGLDPGPNFSSRWYLNTYEDVNRAGINPLLHYLRYGKREGRAPNGRVLFLEGRMNDMEVFSKQMQTILQRESAIPLPPPKHLQVRVVGGYSPNFIESGFSSVYPALNRSLKPIGKELKDFNTILDFGCGCGRAIRALATLLPEADLHGTDIDAEAIEWLHINYSTFAEFTVAPPLPPMVYPDNKFDFIFGISVFTHLPEGMQFAWLEELRRISKPGGYLILTTHGEKHYKKMDPEIVSLMINKGFYYCEPGFNYGKSVSLPDFYQNAYHSHAYILREWSKYFEVIDIQALGIDNHQDTVLLSKRAQ